jgi:hypothetical protein
MAQQPRDPRQRLEMIGTGLGGRQQQEDKVHRNVIRRIEIDRRLQPGKYTCDAFKPRQPAMRDRNAAANGRAGKLFALPQRLEDDRAVQAHTRSHDRSQVLEQLALVARLQAAEHVGRAEDVGDVHDIPAAGKRTR